MAPQAEQPSTAETIQTQSIFVVRHGDRWDYQHPEWKETADRVGDPSLSTLGHDQARQVGQFLDHALVKDDIHADQITLLSSPFLRTVQTSNEILAAMKHTKGNVVDTVKIKPEYCVFELDMWGGDYHSSLPDMDERRCYFPRLEDDYETMFVPSLPEDQEQFFSRCDEAMKHISEAFPCDEEKNRVIILVTHAACCIGLVKAATGKSLQDINAAAPCSIYRLTRSSNDNKWDIDHHSKEDGKNGFTGHMTDVGGKTVPWNNFGDKAINKGYTGPPK